MCFCPLTHFFSYTVPLLPVLVSFLCLCLHLPHLPVFTEPFPICLWLLLCHQSSSWPPWHPIQESLFLYTSESDSQKCVCVWETMLPPWHAFHVRGRPGKRVPLLATYKINKVVERKMPFIRMLVVCEDGGLTAPPNHLRRSCMARKPLKGRREVISVNHWDGGRSGHYPPTACSLIDSRCYIVHTVWSHGLFGKWLKGELGKRSGHLLLILHFYLFDL